MEKLNIETLNKLTWFSFRDDIIKQKVSYLENFRGIENLSNNSIMIFTQVKQGKTIHTLNILHDKYGESGGDMVLSGNLSAAKKQAIEVVKGLIQKGEEFYF